MLLSVFVGSGLQLFILTMIALSKFLFPWIETRIWGLFPEVCMYVVTLTCFVQGVSIGCCTYYVSCSTCHHFCLSSSSVFACLGFLSPPNRGALMTAVVVSCGASDCNFCPEAQAPQSLQHSPPPLPPLPPAPPSSFLLILQVLYVFLSFVCGYYSARLYKSE